MSIGTEGPAGSADTAATDEDVLSPGLRDALASVRIEADCRTAWIGEDEVVADSPAAMRYALARTLYEVLHTGRGVRDTAMPRTLRAPEYEVRLAEATPHRETVVPAVLLPTPGPDGSRTVELDGLRVRVPESVRMQDMGAAPDTPGGSGNERGGRRVVLLTLPSARPLISPGFFLVDSGAGRPAPGELLRIYLRVTDADRAPALWNAVLKTLESRSVAYRAKIISNPESLPRNDGMVVYLGPGAWDSAPAVAEAALSAGLPEGRNGAFAHPLALGVTAAWEPKDDRTGMRNLSFGEHRAHVLARACVEAAAEGRERPTARELADACIAANVDPTDPARNLDSAGWPWS